MTRSSTTSQTRHLSPVLMSQMFVALGQAKTNLETEVNPADLEALTERETEVMLHFCCPGVERREVAQALSISPKTLEHHLTNITDKLVARNLSEAIYRFCQMYKEARPLVTQFYT